MAVYSAAVVLAAWSMAPAALGAEPEYTAQNPKYAQKARTNFVDGLKAVEAGVLARVEKMVKETKGQPAASVRVDDSQWTDQVKGTETADMLTRDDVVSQLQDMLRQAGFRVVQETGGQPMTNIVQVRAVLEARQVTVEELSGPRKYWLPTVSATATTGWDGQVVGNASSARFMGTDALAWRAFERAKAPGLLKAVGLVLLDNLRFSADSLIPPPPPPPPELTQDIAITPAEYQSAQTIAAQLPPAAKPPPEDGTKPPPPKEAAVAMDQIKSIFDDLRRGNR